MTSRERLAGIIGNPARFRQIEIMQTPRRSWHAALIARGTWRFDITDNKDAFASCRSRKHLAGLVGMSEKRWQDRDRKVGSYPLIRAHSTV